MTSFGYNAPTSQDFEGFDRTILESETNVPQHVLDTLGDLVTANEMDVILRPMNPDALWHLKHGAAAKGMAIHGKSANKGPVRGLIPLTSSLSKIDPDDIERIQKYQEENRHSLSESEKSLKEIETKLQKALKEILAEHPEKKGAITQEELMFQANISMDSFDTIVQPVNLQTARGEQIYVFEDSDRIAARGEDGPIYAIQAKDGTFVQIDENHNPIGQYTPSSDLVPVEVQVFGKPEIEINTKTGKIEFQKVKPITADVDVLAYGAKTDMTAKKTMDHKEIEQHRARRVQREKEQILRKSGLKFTDEMRKTLARNKLDNEMIERLNAIKNGPELVEKLLEAEEMLFKEHEIEHLKTYGTASGPIRAVVSTLRQELGSYEITHSAEQANYFFTQPLDSEWISITADGNVTMLRGEEELIRAFNESTDNGRIMPPNPNWGWKIDETTGHYAIDPKLKEQNQFVDRLLLVETDDKEQRKAIVEILKTRLELGKLAINQDKKSPEYRSKNMAELDKKLDEQIASYKQEYGKRKETLGVRASEWLMREQSSFQRHVNRVSTPTKKKRSDPYARRVSPRKLTKEEMEARTRQDKRRGAWAKVKHNYQEIDEAGKKVSFVESYKRKRSSEGTKQPKRGG